MVVSRKLIVRIFFKGAFKQSKDKFTSHLDVLSKYFIKHLSDEGSQQLENTKNIPRLYRRTNRDVSLFGFIIFIRAFFAFGFLRSIYNIIIRSNSLKPTLNEILKRQNELPLDVIYFPTINRLLLLANGCHV